MTKISEMTASQLMTKDVVTVRDETPVRQLAELLMRREISGTVVVDRMDRPVGVVSVVDIARASAQGEEVIGTADLPADFYAGDDDNGWGDNDFEDLPLEERSLLVRDIMTPAIYSISESTRVAEIARQMVDNHLHRLLVLRDEEVVGIISSTDILRIVADGPL